MSAGQEKRVAFESVALPLMRQVYQRALQLAGSADVAADLVQETYLRAFRTFENFQPGSNAKAWLLTIVYSTFISRYRRERREPVTIALIEAENVPASPAEASSVVDSHLWASEEVHAALSRLPEDFRVVLLMVDVDDLSYEEVARALDCPVGTVRSRLSRARRLIYQALEQYAREHGFLRSES